MPAHELPTPEVEAVARSLCIADHQDPDKLWPTPGGSVDSRPRWTWYVAQAKAAITALDTYRGAHAAAKQPG